jgi:tRNA(Ile)-lysidine synthase
MNELQRRVETDIRAHSLLRPGQSLLVAVSGGMDSMVLLEMLLRIGPSARWRLTVAHFNHALRGRHSDADERFVRNAARDRGLPFVAGRVEVSGLAAERGISVEMAAREARHAFLSRAAAEAAIDTIALAHHADDQVELFLIRLLRGASVLGLAGMRWAGASPADARCRLVRPLLGCTRSELEAFGRAESVRWRVDASNECLDMLRNRVRQELLPLLERRYQPAIRRVLRREMQALEATAGLVSRLARDWLQTRRRQGRRWQDLDVAVQRQVLCDELIRLRLEPSFDLIEQLRLYPERPVCAESGAVVCRQEGGRLSKTEVRPKQRQAFENGASKVSLRGRQGQGTFAGLVWRWKIPASQARTPPRFGPGREWLDADKVGAQVVLRHWRPGDRFRPSGMPRPVKLQDLFTNLKIPQARRRELIVATTAQGQLWWVEGVRVAEDFKLGPATVRRLCWRWRR